MARKSRTDLFALSVYHFRLTCRSKRSESWIGRQREDVGNWEEGPSFEDVEPVHQDEDWEREGEKKDEQNMGVSRDSKESNVRVTDMLRRERQMSTS